jgi:hypothetical protein
MTLETLFSRFPVCTVHIREVTGSSVVAPIVFDTLVWMPGLSCTSLTTDPLGDVLFCPETPLLHNL